MHFSLYYKVNGKKIISSYRPEHLIKKAFSLSEKTASLRDD